MKKYAFLVVFVVYTFALGNSRFDIPDCENLNNDIWNKCRGAIAVGMTTYVGEFQNGLPEGYGTFTYSDGAIYVGEFKNGKEHGKGTFRCWNHGSSYTGEFKNGKKNGKGTYNYPDGVVYIGEWVEGKRDGFGEMIYTDGKKIFGEFKNDKFVKK